MCASGGMLAIAEPVARVSILAILLVIRLLIAGLRGSEALHTEILARRMCRGQYSYFSASICWCSSIIVVTLLSESTGSKDGHAQDQAQSKRDAYFAKFSHRVYPSFLKSFLKLDKRKKKDVFYLYCTVASFTIRTY